MPPAERPNHRYYAACQGVWRARVSMCVTDPARLVLSGMRLADRLSLRVMAAWPRWLGTFSLDTTVTYDASGQVRHTTVVRWLGIPMQRSVETFLLDDDGRRFTVSGGMTGAGTIDETGTRAEYDLVWLGAKFHQSTVLTADLVTVTQTGEGFDGVQRLVRQHRAQ